MSPEENLGDQWHRFFYKPDVFPVTQLTLLKH